MNIMWDISRTSSMWWHLKLRPIDFIPFKRFLQEPLKLVYWTKGRMLLNEQTYKTSKINVSPQQPNTQ